MSGFSNKVIRDPVYGYIDVTPEQLEVINLPVFQRLRRVSQLSFSDLVYPNATHNRFAHCLGVMHLAKIVSRYLEDSGIGKEANLSEEDYQALEWAGLLHDIGHLPFSHVSEASFANFLDNESKWKDYHVTIGVKKVINNPEFGIKDKIPKNILTKVVKLMDKDGRSDCRLLDEILGGLCSIDRLDYLLRDAHHAGCPEYAIIDYKRILTTITYYSEHPNTAPVFKEKARFALEGVVLSYFNMYRAMYYHHAVRSAFLLFQDIIWDAFEKCGLKDDLQNIWKPVFWNNFDDHQLLSILRSKKNLDEKFKRQIFRDLPKRIKDEDIKGFNRRNIFNLLRQGSSFQKKVEKEREIVTKIKEKDRNSKLLSVLLESPVLAPYPGSLFSGRAIYIWSGKTDEEPVNLSEKSPHLKDLENASDQQIGVRVYVYPGTLTDDQNFIRILNEAIQETLDIS